MKLESLALVSVVLVIIGGLNWGLVGLWDYNLVTELFDEGTRATQVIYVLIGLAAVHVATMTSRFRA